MSSLYIQKGDVLTFKKKLLCVVLISSIIANLGGYAFAASNQNVSASSHLRVLTTENLISPLSDSENNFAGLSGNTVKYSYSFEPSETDSYTATVRLLFDLDIEGKSYPIELAGDVTRYDLAIGDVFWEGPLYGYAEIKEIAYSIIASFSKVEANNNIQVTVTMQAEDADSNGGMIIFTFGDDIVTADVYNELSQIKKDAVEIADDGIEPYATTNFTYLGGALQTFTGNAISGYAQYAKGYFEKGTNRYAVSFRSYCENVEKYVNSTIGNGAKASISSLSYTLKRGTYTTSSYSYIAGIEKFDFLESNFGKSGTSLRPLLEEGMSLLGIPTSAISIVLDSLKGTVEKDDGTNEYSVNFTFGLLENADFDDAGNGVPIIFQFGIPSSNYTGNSEYTLQTNVTYRVLFIPVGETTTQILYFSAKPATVTTKVTLSK